MQLPDLSALPLSDPPPAGTTYAAPNAAVGYLHANCGHCHNPTSGVFAVDTPVVLRLETDMLATLAATPTYRTSVNVTGDPAGGRTTLAVPGMPDQSIMVYRFETTTSNERMPAIGSEVMDPSGAAMLRAWITNL